MKETWLMMRNRSSNNSGVKKRLFPGLGLGIFVFALLAAPAQSQDRSLLQPSVSIYGEFLAGRFAQSQNDMNKAAKFFSQALKQEPGNPALQRQTYLLLAMSGRIDEAATLAALSLNDKESDLALTIVAIQDIKKGHYDEAEKKLSNISNNDAGAAALRAWNSLGDNRPAGRLQHALKLLAPLANDPGLSRMYYLHAGLMAELTRQPEEARKYYSLLLEKNKTLPLHMVEIVATFYLRQGLTQQAERLLNDTVTPEADGFLIDTKSMLAAGRSLPAPVTSIQEGASEVLSGIASSIFFSRMMPDPRRKGQEAFIADQQTDLAMLLARLGQHLHPQAPRARILLGDILVSQKRYDDAIGMYMSVDSASPLHWMGIIKAAENIAYTGKVDKALKLLKTVEENRPGKIEPLLTRADILRQDKRYEKAAEAYGMAISQTDPNDDRSWFLFYGRGICFERTQQWEKAEADLQHALQLYPDQPEVLNYLGYSWIEMGHRLTDAMGMIEKAVSQRPHDGYIIDSLGWAHYRLGRYDEAVEILERAVAARPDDPTINDHLGDALWHTGRFREATFQWERALSYNPEPEDAAKIRKKLGGEPPANEPIHPQPAKNLVPL